MIAQGQVPASITEEGLLSKSRVYIQRAFRAKMANDLDEYQLWASLALELLGKAVLAHYHPSLVVDPIHHESLFAASGFRLSTDIKTITSKTLYSRLGYLSKHFDTKIKEFCDAISLRRNAELHSGELPFHQMIPDAWEGRFWHAAEIISGILGLSLDEWIGADHAKAPKTLIKLVQEAMHLAVAKRVEQAREHFLDRPKKLQKSTLELSQTKEPHHFTNLFKTALDHQWAATCPACSGKAFLSGNIFEEDIVESNAGEEGWEEEVEISYNAEEFHCPTCELHLQGVDEIEAAKIATEHRETEMRQRDYEPDYGNC